jgi:beta-lactamase class A
MRSRINWLGLFAVVSLLASGAFFIYELFLYSRGFAQLPAGLSLGSVPVGGLTESEALGQLVTAYNAPIELRYHDEVILLDPAVVRFQINTGVMLPQASQYRSNENFWGGLWDHLWGLPSPVRDVPLRATYSQEELLRYLRDVAARYDRPGNPPEADPGTLGFKPGAPGHTLNVDAAVQLVDAALHSPQPEDRLITLPVAEQTAVRPTFSTLSELLVANAGRFQFDGVLSLFVTDLSTGDELNFTLSNNQPVTGPVAFSGLSTIKIPIMVSFFARNEGELTEDENLLLQRSLDESQNTATDLLLKTIGRGDGLEGTLHVTDDMRQLGLSNTYISGLLDVVGSVLTPFATPANTRADLNLRPDPYNQTVPEEMGALLVMVHQCTEGGGPLMIAFPGQFAPEECQKMIQFLTENQVGPIFISGGTPGGVVAHKHGWDSAPLTNMADAALVFTPGGDYAMTIYVHREAAMIFDDANRMIISMARAVYNYYNETPPAP